MIVQRIAFLLLCSLGFLSLSSEAFAFTSRTCNLPTTSRLAFRPSTCLCSADTDAESKEPSNETEESSKETAEKPKVDAGNDILNSPAFLKRKPEVLQSDIKKVEEDTEAAKTRLEEGRKEWGSQIEDLEKEYKLIQQRLNAQGDTNDDQATMQVARQMLEVLDNFDRALGQVTAETDEQKAIEAEYQKAYDSILETFKKLGVEEIQCEGTEFDYELHQAVMQKPSDDYEEGIVCEELQKGFKIGDTLVRASMVAVAA